LPSRHLCDVGDNYNHLADVGIGHADSEELSVLLDTTLLIALPIYLDVLVILCDQSLYNADTPYEKHQEI